MMSSDVSSLLTVMRMLKRDPIISSELYEIRKIIYLNVYLFNLDKTEDATVENKIKP